MALINTSYTLTPAEYVEASRAYRSRIAATRWFFNSIPLLGVVLVLLGVVTRQQQQSAVPIVMLGLGAALLVYRATWSLRQRSAFGDSDLRESRSLEADEAGLKIDREFGGAKLNWGRFRKIHETRHLFLVFSSPKIFAAIPKQAFAGDDLATFRDLLRRNVPPSRKKSGLVTAAALFVLWAVLVVTFGGLVFNPLVAQISKLTGSNRGYKRPRPIPEKAAAVESLHASAKVYFVAFDDASESLLEKLVPYYRNKYRIDIEVLPKLVPQPWTEDPDRRQAIAEELIAEMRYAYADIANNPHNAVLGLTSRDMYMLGRAWDFTYNLREDERIGVISSGRVDPAYFGKSSDDALLETRVRKLITKNLGIVCFHLDLSNNPYSVLYYDFEDPEDVDTASEDYLQSDTAEYQNPREQQGDPCLIVRHYHADDGKRTDELTLEDCWAADSREPGLEVFQVNLRFGLFLDQRTDFLLPDVLPIELTRVYRNQDNRSRAFGVGANHSLDIVPLGDTWPFSFIDLCREGGARSHFERKSFGVAYWDAVYRGEDGLYLGAEIKWNWPGWKLTLTNGTTYFFPDGGGIQRPEQGALIGVRDKWGNRLKFVRQPSGELTSVTSPKHRLEFAYDAGHHITHAQDERGHSFSYRYDGDRLVEVDDDQGRDIEYAYDSQSQMVEAAEEHARVIVKAAYQEDRVNQLTLGNGRSYQLEYVLDGKGKVIGATLSQAGKKLAEVSLRTRSYSRGFVIRWLDSPSTAEPSAQGQ